jgi:hypothetical protein
MQKVKEVFIRFWRFIKKHKWSVSLVIMALLVGGFFIWDSITAGTFTPSGEITLRPKKEEKFQAPLSGRMVEKERTTRKPMAVVIENHPDARPQSGLNEAAVVYETLAEGGITRFLAIFQENDVTEIGPVRSARPYFVNWAESYKAIYAHVGGNIDALDLIGKIKNFYDINQFVFGNYFWRDVKKYAPHNVYTTTQKLIDAARSKGYPVTDDSISAYLFKDDEEEGKRPADFSFVVNFNPNFAVTWTYSAKSNEFNRFMQGKAQTDSVTKEQIKAKNVIVMFSDFSYGTTRYGEQATKIRTTGTGSAIFYIDGLRSTGTWKRSEVANPTRFYDVNGLEVKLNAGTTWICVAPTGTAVQ